MNHNVEINYSRKSRPFLYCDLSECHCSMMDVECMLLQYEAILPYGATHFDKAQTQF